MGGAFLLIRKNHSDSFMVDNALQSFKNLGFTNEHEYCFGSWKLFYYDKQLIKKEIKNSDENINIFITGTCIIHGLSVDESMAAITDHYIKHKELPNSLIGNYCIIICQNDKIYLHHDPENIYNIFLAKDFSVISSSFLALCDGMTKLTINREAIIENLCTGSLIGEDTIFSEINRVTYNVDVVLPEKSLLLFSKKEKFVIPHFHNKKESLSAQIDILDWYFAGIKALVKEYGLDSGLTGGFDSRLLMALIKRHFSDVSHQFHSHKRKVNGAEYLIAKHLCTITSSSFVEEESLDINDMDDIQIGESIKRGMYFYDGQIRSHAFWHESFNNLDYRKKILKDKRVGFHGIGGEQYRNIERMHKSDWNYELWIKYNIIRKLTGNKVLNKPSMDNLVDSLSYKINQIIPVSDNKIDHLGLKRYLNEVFIPSNRGVRTSMENKLTYFFSPFTDFRVSVEAYGAVPFLGNSLNYQAEIINLISPELANETSDYGFNFISGERASEYFPRLIGENYIHPILWESILYNMKNKKGNLKWCRLNKTSLYLHHLTDVVQSMNININLEDLLKSSDLGPSVFSLGFILEHYHSKII